MKKLALVVVATLFTAGVFAQQAPKAAEKPEVKKEAGAEKAGKKAAKKHHGGKHHKKEEAAK